jgi:hypothetical protein
VAYTKADTSAKVGFRPYGHTNPFGAAHFACVPEHTADPAMGVYYLNRPFDPWELYDDVHHTGGIHLGDLGQNHPFKPQAWHLHGLGAGTDVTAEAADELLNSGHITRAEHDAILDGSMGFQDVLGVDPTDQSSWFDATGWMREWNQKLQSLEQEYRNAAPAPGTPGYTAQGQNAALSQLGAQLAEQRQHYNQLAAEFVRYYTLVMGSAPSGLSGLGFLPIAYVAGAVALYIVLYVAYQAFLTWQQGVNVSSVAAEAQHQTATTDRDLAAQLAAAQARGDTVTANAIIALMKQRAVSQTPPGATAKWLMDNAKWLALGAAGLIAIGPITQGLFGGRRR